MSNVTFQAFVQALGAASALNGTELLAMIQSGNPVQVALGNLLIALNQASIPTGGNGIYVPSANTLGFAVGNAQAGTLNANAMTMPALAVTGATVPTNGIYLPSANTLGVAANSQQAASVSSTRQWNLYEPNFLVASLKQAATMDSGTFTATLTGVSGTVTGTMNWVRTGNLVTLYSAAGLTGTSNSTACGITGVPASLQPVNNIAAPVVSIEDNSVTALYGVASISGGTITLFKSAGSSYTGTFTNGGTKGITGGWSFTYPLQ